MFNILKKTIAVGLIGFGIRNTNGIITSCQMVAIYYRNWNHYFADLYGLQVK